VPYLGAKAKCSSPNLVSVRLPAKSILVVLLKPECRIVGSVLDYVVMYSTIMMPKENSFMVLIF
jgi:hypothetical protein